MERMRIDWTTPAGRLTAIEPTLDEVAAHATALAAGYNHPRNATLLGHVDLIDPDEVVEHYADLPLEGGRGFLLFVDDHLAGDADLRGVADGAAEFAFLIAAPEAQGKGLGTRFAAMITAFGFAVANLTRVYASIVPANAASARVFAKLGFTVDDSAAALAYADEPGDVVLSIDRPTFERANAAALAELRITRCTEPRSP
jgi:RimJ/RimL family protein N-acetyltransferase